MSDNHQPRGRRRGHPCRNCVYDGARCRRCQRLQLSCISDHKQYRPIRFHHHVFSLRSETQPLISTATRRFSRLQFIDQTLEVSAGYHIEEDLESRPAVGDRHAGVNESDHFDASPPAISPLEPVLNLQPDLAHTSRNPSGSTLPGSHHVVSSLSLEQPSTYEPHRSGRLQAILLRFYITEIAHRFDLCDPEHHFTNVVPKRAQSSPPLLNAILTTSARHLCQIARYRNANGKIEWQGHLLPELSQESPVYFHNECIRDLLALSVDPGQVYNENLLAAAVILRTDEEMNGPFNYGDEDSEVFLRMLNIFINAQVSPTVALGQDSPQAHPLHPNQTDSSHTITHIRDDALNLRRAVFVVALRQELFTSFMKRRSLRFQLSHYDYFRDLSPTEDSIWANRGVVFCADVFEYCYGSSNVSEGYHSHHSNIERWRELQLYERQLTMALPRSFEPLYYRPANPHCGEVFPEIWHLNTYHRTGSTHLQLARLLLTVFDPSLPRLGPGLVTSQRELGRQLREIVVRLCGIAMCNRTSPPAFIEALMSISTCGEYFELPHEQEALLKFLQITQEDWGYQTFKVRNALEKAWGFSSSISISSRS